MADDVQAAFDSLPAGNQQQQNAAPSQAQPAPQPQQAKDPVQSAFDSLPAPQAQGQQQTDNAQPYQTGDGGLNPNSWFMQKIDEVNHAFDRMALGTLKRMDQLGSGVVYPIAKALGATVPEGDTPFTQGVNQAVNQTDTRYNNAWKADPGASSYLATGAGLVGASIPYGAGLAALAPEALGIYGTNVLVGAGLGFADPSNSGLETATKTIGGGLLGAAVPYGMKVAEGIYSKLFHPSNVAIESMADAIKGDPNALQQLQGAVDNTGQGDNLSAGSVFPAWASKEADLKTSKAVQDTVIRPQYLNQVDSTKQNLLNTVNDMSPDLKQSYLDKLSNLEMGDATLGDIHNALFKGDAGKAQFLNDVEASGGSPALANSTLYMAKKLDKSPVKQILDGGTTEQKPVGLNLSAMANWAKDKLNSRYSHALLDLTLNQKNWAPALQHALGQGSAQARETAFKALLQTAASYMPNAINKAAGNVAAGVQAAAPIAAAAVPAMGLNNTVTGVAEPENQ